MILADKEAEKAILAGIFQFGHDAYFDIADIISENTFTDNSYAAFFKCFKNILESDNNAKIDTPSIYSIAKILNLDYFIQRKEETEKLNAVINTPVILSNIRKFAAIIRKLEISRLLHGQFDKAQNRVLELNGTETYNEILGIAENVIFDFSTLINNSKDDEPTSFFKEIQEHVNYLVNNPIENIGLSSGFSVYDAAIGGGFRNGTLSVLAARMKVGKSMYAINVGTHIAKNLNIPVLYLDTEMSKTEHLDRILALLSNTPINLIETGKFIESMEYKNRVLQFVNNIDTNIPFYYVDVGSKQFEEILSIIRRWIMKYVGINDDGTAKQCFVIYDWMRLLSSDNIKNDLKEYQILGFMMTGFVNIAKRYQFPILVLTQLNRDGVTKETSDTIGGSDRIAMFCNNLSLLKYKSPEEIAEDGIENGNRKLIVLMTRSGPGLEYGNYINMQLDGEYAKLKEMRCAYANQQEDIIVDDINDEIPFIG